MKPLEGSGVLTMLSDPDTAIRVERHGTPSAVRAYLAVAAEEGLRDDQGIMPLARLVQQCDRLGDRVIVGPTSELCAEPTTYGTYTILNWEVVERRDVPDAAPPDDWTLFGAYLNAVRPAMHGNVFVCGTVPDRETSPHYLQD